MPNLLQPEFDDVRDHPGFACRRARLGRQAGARSLGASLWELPPGEAAYPYHFHHVEEELIAVVSGRPSLRTPEGWRELEEGEVVAFPVGEAGAHQLLNRTGEPARFLSFSTGGEPEIVVYPDSDKVGLYGRSAHPGLSGFYRRSEGVDYYEGESPPAR